MAPRNANAVKGSFGAKGKIAKSVIPKKPPRVDDGLSAPVDPVIPPELNVAPVGEFIWSTEGGTLTLEAMGVGKVTGGAPAVIETEIVGRVAGTSMGDPSRRSLALQVIARGRVVDVDVDAITQALTDVAVGGQVVRVYGPMDRPGCQGVPWTLAEPGPDDCQLQWDGSMIHATWSLELSEWTPLDAIVFRRAGTSSKRVRAKKRTLRLNQGSLNDQLDFDRGLGGLGDNSAFGDGSFGGGGLGG